MPPPTTSQPPSQPPTDQPASSRSSSATTTWFPSMQDAHLYHLTTGDSTQCAHRSCRLISSQLHLGRSRSLHSLRRRGCQHPVYLHSRHCCNRRRHSRGTSNQWMCSCETATPVALRLTDKFAITETGWSSAVSADGSTGFEIGRAHV